MAELVVVGLPVGTLIGLVPILVPYALVKGTGEFLRGGSFGEGAVLTSHSLKLLPDER